MPRRFPILVTLLTLLLVGCVPQGMRLPQSPLLAALERKSGRIVVSGADGNLYTTDQSGGDVVALTTDASDTAGGSRIVYALPTWSPTDSRIAYARYSLEGAFSTSAPRATSPRQRVATVMSTRLRLAKNDRGERESCTWASLRPSAG
jgi:hypothetical protein